MSDLSRSREPTEPPKPPLSESRSPQPESGVVLALLIGCIAVLFIVGIRLAYDHAETVEQAANPPAIVGASAQQTANAPSAPAETTGSTARDQNAKPTGDAAKPAQPAK